MASAGLALKATAIAAVLAMLVIPSSGSYPLPGLEPPSPAPETAHWPEPTPPLPAPGPSPWPEVAPCMADCYLDNSCISECSGSINLICTVCQLMEGPHCGECMNAEFDRCTASCTGGGCDYCGDAARSACATACSFEECNSCRQGRREACMAKCGSPADCYTCFRSWSSPSPSPSPSW
ncbi:hypothetical protein ACQJBY_072074 [Aegilops geniculata]